MLSKRGVALEKWFKFLRRGFTFFKRQGSYLVK